MWTLARMYSEGRRSRPVTAGGRLSSTRASMKGSISPMCPITSCSRGWRSKTPASTMRSTCSPVSACQPYAAALRNQLTAGIEALVVGVADRGHRLGRVQVERHAQALEAREQHVEVGVVEEAPARVAVDHRALHAELAHRALELVGGGLGRRGRQRGEGREAVGMLGDGARELVVRLARERDRPCRVSRCWTPGVVWLMTCRSMPASSMAARRRSPRSSRSAASGESDARGVGVAQGADRPRDVRRPEVVLEADDAHGGIFAVRDAQPRRVATLWRDDPGRSRPPSPCSPPPRSRRPRARASGRPSSSRPARSASAWRPTPTPPARRPRSSPATDTVRASSSARRRRLVGGDAAAGRPRGHGRPGRRRRRHRRARDRLARRQAARLQRHRRRHARSRRDAERADPRSPARTPGACATRRSPSTPRATRCWPTTPPRTKSTSTCAARSRSPTARAAARSPRRRSSTRRRRARRPSPSGATARASSRGRTTAGSMWSP